MASRRSSVIGFALFTMCAIACSSESADSLPEDGGSGSGGAGNTSNTGGNGNIGGSGNTGNTGGSGNTGNTGGSGNTGNTGGSGNTGNTGGSGNTGNTGGSGNTGNTGGSGNTGNTGGSGNTGNTGGSGNTGNTGGSGNTGNTGGSGNTGGGSSTCAAGSTHQGGITQYDPTPLGNCGEPWPGDNMYVAMATADYNSPMPAGVCGKCLEVTGPTGWKKVVKAVDQCPVGSNPKCVAGHLDLSHPAYSAVVPGNLPGEVPNSSPVPWKFVPCPVSGPIVYHFKDGTNQYWAAVQIRNSRYGIKKVEYQNNGGWVALTPRTNDLAYFVYSGGSKTSFNFRVTDEYDQVLVDNNVNASPNANVNGAGQFPQCN